MNFSEMHAKVTAALREDGPPKGYIAKTFMNIPVHEDPNAPRGQFYFINSDYMEFYRIDTRSRPRRVLDWLKNALKEPWNV